jgi:hypothetical protein
MPIESIQEVREAVERAKRDIYRAEQLVAEMAFMCKGRLRNSNASAGTLAELKKELRDFDIRTGTWSDK